jgi:hypothetical protein
LNEQLTVFSLNNNVQTNFVKYENIGGTPTVDTYGNLVTSNLSFKQSQTNLITFKNPNPISPYEFVGIGVGANDTSNSLIFQIPSAVYGANKYIFKNGASEMMRLQSDVYGNPQLGLGITALTPNVSLQVAGNATITGELIVGGLNFATGYVKLDPTTNRISCNIMPTGVVYTSGASNKIDTSLLPMPFQAQYFKTNKNFGIGTRTPLQRLHVAGSTYVTDRVGIGASQPAARLDIVESAATLPAATITSSAGGDVLQTYISVGGSGIKVPVLSIVGTHQGVGIGTSYVKPENALEIYGITEMNGTLNLNSNISINGGGEFNARVSAFSLSTVTDSASVFSTQINSAAVPGSKVSLTCGVPMTIGTLTVNSSLSCYGNTFLVNGYSQSDLRLKKNIKVIPDALKKIDNMSGYTYTMVGNESTTHAGVIAQEVAKAVPEAITHIPGTEYLAVNYNAVIALLVESVKELSNRVKGLENELSTLRAVNAHQ